MRILVTGKNGQLGRSIHKVVNITNSGNQLSNEFIFVGREELDLSDENNINNYFYNNGKFDVIINCAAYTAVDRAEEEQALANQVNHLAVKQLATVANRQKAKLISLSTDYVFDGESDKPYAEKDEVNPINVYGKTKLAGEDSIQKIMPTDAIIIRTSWVYSEYGNNFVDAILKIAKERDEISIIGDQVGSPTYATDLATTILTIVNNKRYFIKNQKSKIYHYSGKGECSWYGFAKEILELAKIKCRINKITTEQYGSVSKRPKYCVLSNNKIQLDFGIKPKHWKDSLRIYLKRNH